MAKLPDRFMLALASGGGAICAWGLGIDFGGARWGPHSESHVGARAMVLPSSSAWRAHASAKRQSPARDGCGECGGAWSRVAVSLPVAAGDRRDVSSHKWRISWERTERGQVVLSEFVSSIAKSGFSSYTRVALCSTLTASGPPYSSRFSSKESVKYNTTSLLNYGSSIVVASAMTLPPPSEVACPQATASGKRCLTT